MRVVILGGGKLGYYLAQNLTDREYEVKLIEKDRFRSAKIANDLEIEVICGDGTEIQTLIDAGISKADCFVAVTGRDQDNLVASQLVQGKFMVDKVIARANNPRNLEALRELGVENAVSSTEIITRMIEQEIDSSGIQLLASLNKGQAAICAITVPLHAEIEGTAIKDINLPSSSLVISVLRDETLIIPQGDTIIYSGDQIVAVCEAYSQKELKKIFSKIRKDEYI